MVVMNADLERANFGFTWIVTHVHHPDNMTRAERARMDWIELFRGSKIRGHSRPRRAT
jgi:hypothetical protein